jgi:hypothetical protein
MSTIDLDDRHFETTESSQSSGGDLAAGTVYHYRQQGDVVWATYEGPGILFGTVLGQVAPDGTLTLRHQHLSPEGSFRTGSRRVRPEILPDSRVRLHEEWEGDGGAGRAVTEEIG